MENDPVHITVLSNTDFDEQHPAGTALNDLILYEASTAYPFIKSGYNKNVLHYTQIIKLLSLCNSEDFIMTNYDGTGRWMDELFSLTFIKEPEEEKEHIITIEIIDDLSKNWKASTPVNFSKGHH